MTEDVFSLLLDKKISELNGKALDSRLSRVERAELRALQRHQEKAPAVLHRIRILAAKLSQPSRWGVLWLQFSRKFRQNLAELEALSQYGNSKAVWEIAYLTRKKAAHTLTAQEAEELHYLSLYHDSPDVLRITILKLKHDLSASEARELDGLQRNPYRQGGVPHHLLEMLWPEPELDAAEAFSDAFGTLPMLRVSVKA